MKKLFFDTHNDVTGLILRLTAGLVVFPHGAQKMLGWFGGYGFAGTMGFFTDTMRLPRLLGFLVIVIEFFGSLSLLMGFAGRFWAACIAFLMLGIVYTSHLGNGFFMNWYGTQPGEGFEYHLLVIGLAIGIVANGSGKFSVDGKLSERLA